VRPIVAQRAARILARSRKHTPAVPWVQGVVVSVASGVAQVTQSGGTNIVPAHLLKHVTAVAGDTVWMANTGTQLIVIGVQS
jgi:hypothetical protein